jgi:hypothetical protein
MAFHSDPRGGTFNGARQQPNRQLNGYRARPARDAITDAVRWFAATGCL